MDDGIVKSNSFERTLAWMLKYPLVILACVAVVTVFFAWRIPTLTFRTSIYDLAIENLPETARYQAFKNEFGSDEIISQVFGSSV